MSKTILRGRARLVPRVSADVSPTTPRGPLRREPRHRIRGGRGGPPPGHLGGTSDQTLLLRRLNRLGRALERIHRDLELLSEAFGVFIRLWFAHTPAVHEDAKPSARRIAESRYKQFIEHVTHQPPAPTASSTTLPREPLAGRSRIPRLQRGSPSPGVSQGAFQTVGCTCL